MDPNGLFIILENTNRSREELIGEWKLKRKIDGKREIVYTFPRDYILRPGRTVKVIKLIINVIFVVKNKNNPFNINSY